MDKTTIGFVLGALVLFLFAHIKNPSLAISGTKQGLATFMGILVLLIASMVIAGLIQVLIPREIIGKYLGAGSGFRGILFGSFIGALMPGPPYASFPVAAGLLKGGAGIGPVVALVTGWSLWQVTRIPFEIATIGGNFVWIRILSTFFFPPFAGMIAQMMKGAMK